MSAESDRHTGSGWVPRTDSGVPEVPRTAIAETTAVDAFTAAWENAARAAATGRAATELPEIASYLPDARTLRAEALVELIRVDLRHRWLRRAAAQSADEVARKRLHDYCAEFPELELTALPAGLVYEEFVVRRHSGERIDPRDCLREYPAQAARLSELLNTDDLDQSTRRSPAPAADDATRTARPAADPHRTAPASGEAATSDPAPPRATTDTAPYPQPTAAPGSVTIDNPPTRAVPATTSGTPVVDNPPTTAAAASDERPGATPETTVVAPGPTADPSRHTHPADAPAPGTASSTPTTGRSDTTVVAGWADIARDPAATTPGSEDTAPAGARTPAVDGPDPTAPADAAPDPTPAVGPLRAQDPAATRPNPAATRPNPGATATGDDPAAAAEPDVDPDSTREAAPPDTTVVAATRLDPTVAAAAESEAGATSPLGQEPTATGFDPAATPAEPTAAAGTDSDPDSTQKAVPSLDTTAIAPTRFDPTVAAATESDAGPTPSTESDSTVIAGAGYAPDAPAAESDRPAASDPGVAPTTTGLDPAASGHDLDFPAATGFDPTATPAAEVAPHTPVAAEVDPAVPAAAGSDPGGTGLDPNATAASGFDPTATAAGYDPTATAAAGYGPTDTSGFDPNATATAGFDPTATAAAGYDPTATAAAGFDPTATAAVSGEAEESTGTTAGQEPGIRGILDRIEIGRRIDDFDLLTGLGSGAFARVFLARQRSLQRLVAVKISADHGTEPQTLAQLDHDYIVRVFDQRLLDTGGDLAGARRLRLLYMQFLPGGTLLGVLRWVRATPPEERSGRTLLDAVDAAMEEKGEIRPTDSSVRAEIAALDWPETVAWLGRRLAEALDYASEHGVLHRDVKPANVLLTAEGVPKLADFNISFSRNVEGTSPVAYFGGSLAYMSPEQLEACHPGRARGAADLDTRADIYSLGVVLWELLTGHKPFDDSSLGPHSDDTTLDAMLERRIAGVDEAALEQLPPECPAALRRVLLTCLEPERDDRWSNGKTLAQQLEMCLDPRARDLVDPPPHSWRLRLRRWIVPVLFLAVGVPNVLASLYNIQHNQQLIVDRMPEDAQRTFLVITGVVNAVFFPAGLVLILYLARYVLSVPGGLRKGRRYDAATLRRARADALRLGEWVVMIPFALWVLAGLTFPATLQLATGDITAQAVVHFLASIVVCGAIAASYPFFLATFYIVRCVYPIFLRHGEVSAEDAVLLRNLDRRANLYLAVAASVPLLAVAGVTFLPPGDIPHVIVAVRVLCAGGIIAFVGSYLLFRALEADLRALERVVAPGGDERSAARETVR